MTRRYQNQAEAIWHIISPHPKIQNLTYGEIATVVLFDSCLSSPAACTLPSGSVPTMAEVHPAPAAPAGIVPTDGSTLITLQQDVGSIKQEMKDLRKMVESLVKEIENMKRVKVETVGNRLLSLSASSRSLLPVHVCFRFQVDHRRSSSQSSLLFPIIGSILRCM